MHGYGGVSPDMSRILPEPPVKHLTVLTSIHIYSLLTVNFKQALVVVFYHSNILPDYRSTVICNKVEKILGYWLEG